MFERLPSCTELLCPSPNFPLAGSPSVMPRSLENITSVEYQGPNNWQIKIRSKHG